MSLLRRVVCTSEDLVTELAVPVATPVRRAAVAVVLRNPWAGRGVVGDLQPEVRELAPLLAEEIATRLAARLGGAANIESFGKAAIVGLDGELEHGAALIHTPYFGNLLRTRLRGTSIIAFSDQRGPAGTAIAVPVWHKDAAATRSHYAAIEVRVPDAPRADELVIVAAAATGARPNARIGDRTSDPVVEFPVLESTALESTALETTS